MRCFFLTDPLYNLQFKSMLKMRRRVNTEHGVHYRSDEAQTAVAWRHVSALLPLLVPLTCICCAVCKCPFTNSQYKVLMKLGPPKSSIVFSLKLSPITVVVVAEEEDASRRRMSPPCFSGLSPAVALWTPSRRTRSPMFTRDLLNILTVQRVRSLQRLRSKRAWQSRSVMLRYGR